MNKLVNAVVIITIAVMVGSCYMPEMQHRRGHKQRRADLHVSPTPSRDLVIIHHHKKAVSDE